MTKGHQDLLADRRIRVSHVASQLHLPGRYTAKGGRVQKKQLFAGIVAAACVSVGLGVDTQRVLAQQPSQSPATTGSQTAAASTAGSTTLTGCVYRERDVPGRTPNVAERAGVLEDYILADVKPGTHQAGETAGSPTATGTAGKTGAMYKLEHADDDRLRALVGKRVEVMGRIDAEPGDARQPGGKPTTTPPADRSVGPDRIELPEFEITSIREVSGTCPAKPGTK